MAAIGLQPTVLPQEFPDSGNSLVITEAISNGDWKHAECGIKEKWKPKWKMDGKWGDRTKYGAD